MYKKNKSHKTINVLHIISRLNVGGAEKLLTDIIKQSESCNSVKYFLLIMQGIYDDDLKKELGVLDDSLNIWPNENYRNPYNLLKLWKLIKDNNIGIIHTHEDGSKRWSYLCKLINPKIKLVYTSHGNNDLGSLDRLGITIYNLFISKLIVISDPIKNSCLKVGLNKIEVIYNGVDLKKFNCKRKNKNKDFLNIINVSRLIHSVKGQDVLIKALDECKKRGLNFKCTFVGGPINEDSESFIYLKQLIKESNLENDVFFLGNRKDVADLLSNSDLFILASRTEAMPLVLLEAMASGLPVIASDIPGTKALIRHKENGYLFERENHIDLANKIEEIYYNKEKMYQIAQNGFNFVQNFDISNMVEKYNNLYKSLVKS